MRRWWPLVAVVLVLVGAGVGGGLWYRQHRAGAELEAMTVAMPPISEPRALAPGKEAKDCDAGLEIPAALASLQTVYDHERQALGTFLDKPRPEGIQPIFGALERNQAALEQLLDAPSCQHASIPPESVDVEALELAAELVEAQAMVLVIHRKNVGALRWLADLSEVGMELQRWQLQPFEAGLGLSERAREALQRLLLANRLPPSEVPWLVGYLRHANREWPLLSQSVRVETRMRSIQAGEGRLPGVEGLTGPALVAELTAYQKVMAGLEQGLNIEPYPTRQQALGSFLEQAAAHPEVMVRDWLPFDLARLDARRTHAVASSRVLQMAAAAWEARFRDGACPSSAEGLRMLHGVPTDPYTGAKMAWDGDTCTARAGGEEEGVSLTLPALPSNP